MTPLIQLHGVISIVRCSHLLLSHKSEYILCTITTPHSTHQHVSTKNEKMLLPPKILPRFSCCCRYSNIKKCSSGWSPVPEYYDF
jgi:hypothetical protein